jgi:hypothetical protein
MPGLIGPGISQKSNQQTNEAKLLQQDHLLRLYKRIGLQAIEINA